MIYMFRESNQVTPTSNPKPNRSVSRLYQQLYQYDPKVGAVVGLRGAYMTLDTAIQEMAVIFATATHLLNCSGKHLARLWNFHGVPFNYGHAVLVPRNLYRRNVFPIH